MKMKKLSDTIGNIVTLFFVCALIYGGLKDGYVVQTILVVGGIIFIIYLFTLREDNILKEQQRKQEKENKEKFDIQFEKFAFKMYGFAYSNDRISRITYDIEEGGDYLTEYDANVCRTINNIIKKQIQYPNINFESVRVTIENEILKLPIKPKSEYVGF